ncbi:hypothetical protein ASPFODRAFT_29893 [Aspergillus luchuensis CBS 106.47]|uniref:Uncharacterized protein n=1 Tax=Aspergillus luchuensis (strain CBS 106.47) TaxID=1137211 RepID=A0A1M3TPU5_ASPLC|nr:hypothetical protein ASPFODRAFT_29893 [Aspergillus luchuensis CBS 106.47]
MLLRAFVRPVWDCHTDVSAISSYGGDTLTIGILRAKSQANAARLASSFIPSPYLFYLTATGLEPGKPPNRRTARPNLESPPVRPLQAYPIPETPERTSGETGMTSGLSLAKLRRYQRGGAVRG